MSETNELPVPLPEKDESALVGARPNSRVSQNHLSFIFPVQIPDIHIYIYNIYLYDKSYYEYT